MATAHSDTDHASSLYDVEFKEEGPLGITLQSSDDGLNAFVLSSERPEIKAGHLLVAVNNEALEGLSFDDILDKVSGASWPRTLSFTSAQRDDASGAVGAADAANALPLPDGFFKGVPPLTDEEEAYIKEFMKDHLEEALRVVRTAPEEQGLRKATESDGIRVWLGDRADAEGEQVQLVMSKVQIPIPADLMMNAAVTHTRGEFKRIFTMLDPMFGDGDVLDVIPKDYERYGGRTVRPENLNLPLFSVKWGAWLLPFPLYNRDFVFCEYTCWAEDGLGVSMCMSIPRVSARVPNLEESHAIVRGNMGMTGYFWRNTEGSDPKKPVGKNAMSIDLTYLLQINIKGAIPRWAVNLVGPQQGLNVKRVRDYALMQRDIITHFFNENTELNGFEALSASLKVGETFTASLHVPAGWELVYEWILQEHDIAFTVLAPDGSEVVPRATHACNVATETPHHGRLTAEQTGDYKLVWDNKDSWFTAKQLYYHMVAVDPNDPLPWPKWPTREEAFAAE